MQHFNAEQQYGQSLACQVRYKLTSHEISASPGKKLLFFLFYLAWKFGPSFLSSLWPQISLFLLKKIFWGSNFSILKNLTICQKFKHIWGQEKNIFVLHLQRRWRRHRRLHQHHCRSSSSTLPSPSTSASTPSSPSQSPPRNGAVIQRTNAAAIEQMGNLFI